VDFETNDADPGSLVVAAVSVADSGFETENVSVFCVVRVLRRNVK